MSFRKLRILTAGESHGPGLVGILEGLPSGLSISKQQLLLEMRRRQLGYGRGLRMKIETDEVEILGGIRAGKTLGSPVSILIKNKDFLNWEETMDVWESHPESSRPPVQRPRPGHADLAGGLKYQTHELRDILERASARETAARTALGALCKQLLNAFDIRIASHVLSIGPIWTAAPDPVDWDQLLSIQQSELLRCLDPQTEQKMLELVDEAKKNRETLGGTIEIIARGPMPGLGSHIQWDQKLDGRIAHAMMSVPAVKGVSIGDAFRVAGEPGSQAHDEIEYDSTRNEFTRKTNRAGGTEGGITNGMDIRVQIAMKPLSTLMKPLQSVDVVTKAAEQAVIERSDVCAVPAAGVVGESMLALVLADALLEKFACDSMTELIASVDQYRKLLRQY